MRSAFSKFKDAYRTWRHHREDGIYKLAQEAGLPIQTVMMVEQKTDPKWSTIVKLADALGVSTEDFRKSEPTRS